MSRAGPGEALIWRARLLAACLALAAVTFRQQPGLVVGDTKADLTLNPWGFLRDALHLWDPQLYFGQLQNQAYGYLFPMGPFHGLLLSAGVPAWIVQRLWWTLLLVLAFLGAWRVAGELVAAGRWARLAGALLYALSPRVVGELTTTSIEVWPVAVAPWVLLPLVVREPRTWRWRITRSALAVALCGGVNAVATGAVLVMPAVWFLTRRPSRQVVLAAASWFAAVVLAIAWWLIPLLILGANSPPFLDWIESAVTTTGTASTYEALRGTSAWLGYLGTPTGPHWPGGWAYVTRPILIVTTAGVVAVGLAGLATRRVRDRAFLATSLVLGIILVTLGHRGPVGPVWTDLAFRLLDGPLAPLRNAHKFDPVVRLPLALATIAGLEAGLAWLCRVGVQRWVQVTVVTALVVAAASPALSAHLARDEAYPGIPQYWRAAAAWLDGQPGDGAVLMLPATAFADFTWGSPKDNPLQAIMRRPFVLRDAVPLGSAGSTRFLDGVNRTVASGRGDPSVAQALAGAGVGFVVVPADLRAGALVDPLVAVEQGLLSSGLRRVAEFGPRVVDPEESADTTIDNRTRGSRPSITVYAVPRPRPALMLPAHRAPTALAGPEDMIALTRIGIPLALLGTDARAVIGGYASADAGILTDGLRRREVFFGAAANNTSAVLSPDAEYGQDRPVHDVIADPTAPETTSLWRGVRSVRASSSAADAGATLRLGAAYGPAAAVDGDITTRWVSGRYGQAEGEWLEVRLLQAQPIRWVRLIASRKSPIGSPPRRILVSTAAGTRSMSLDANGFGTVTPAEGATDWVRFTLSAVESGVPNGMSIAELAIDGVTPRLLLETPPAASPQTIHLRGDDAFRTGCWQVSTGVTCSPATVAPREPPPGIDRIVRLGSGGSYRLEGTVRAASTSGADALLDDPARPRVTASSRLVPGLADRPGTVVDADPATGWVASADDPQPRLTVHLPRERVVRGLQFIPSSTADASRPKEVRIRFGDGYPVTATTDANGYVWFPARRTDLIRVWFGATRPRVGIDGATRERTFLPVGIGELRVVGADDLRRPIDPAAAVDAACGLGPDVTVNGTRLQTRVSGTATDLVEGGTLPWEACGDAGIALTAGANEILAAPNDRFEPASLTMHRQAETGATVLPVGVARDGAARLRLQVPARSDESLVTVAQNFHPGWEARLAGGQPLQAVRVNGWMQGWRVPAGQSASMTAFFAPDAGYRLGLLAGVAALLLVLCAGPLAPYAARLPALAVVGERAAPTGPAPPLRPGGRWGVALAVALPVLTGLALAGPAGAALGLAVPVAVRLRPGAARTILAAAGLAGLGAATARVATAPWPASGSAFDSAVVQVGAVLAVVSLVTAISRRRPAPESGSRSPARARRGARAASPATPSRSSSRSPQRSSTPA